MKHGTIAALLGFSVLALVVGCGGGGGGGGTSTTGGFTVFGRVLDVRTGAAPNPAATVQTASATVNTDTATGAFDLAAPSGATSVSVIPGSGSAFTFNFPPITGRTDLGDLWIGPQTVTVRGRLIDLANETTVSGATVKFAGRTATSNIDGVFNLTQVAYSSDTHVAFWGIPGFISREGYFEIEFSTAPYEAVGGVVDLGDLFLTPVSDPNPPGQPYNIWGRISPSADAPGTVVTASEAGTVVRVFNVGSDGTYFLWLPPGTYRITYQKGGLSAPPQDVTLTQPNEVIRRDVTLG